ncbi:hypothetical protein [Actinotalea solisilvae]|uniref:hypothetical protein n=1 Tax=Actinotalea solisilvae TaxID=2072922 RepID=UPI0018F23A52|nr:hypothetical protein [Actinotalea solisilvae]
MNDDLSSALHDLVRSAARAQGSGDALVTPDVVRRARRGRRRHDAVVGAVSAAAVTAVALTGGTLLRDREPAPPAVTTTHAPSPTPTPQPTATVAPTVLPAGDPALPEGACGSVLGPPPEDDGYFALYGAPTTTEVPAGAALPVEARAGLGGYEDLAVVPDDGPTFLVTRDDVVVARGTAFAGATGVLVLSTGGPNESRTVVGNLDLAVCAPEGQAAVTPGRALPAGEYELHATLAVTTFPTGTELADRNSGDPAEDLVDAPGAAARVLRSAPAAFTVVGEALEPAARVRPPVTAALPEPPAFADAVCGAPAPARWDAGGTLRLEHPVEPLVVGAGEPVDLGAHLVYSGPGRLQGVLTHRVDHWVLQDGALVGRGWPGPSDDWWSQATLDHGATLAPELFSQEWTLTSCDEEFGVGDPLPPGEYVLVPVTELSVDRLVADDGSVVGTGEQLHQLFGDPVPLTIR